MKRFLRSPVLRPVALLVLVLAVLAAADGGQGRVLTAATTYSVLQQFAILGPLALALGLTMMVREIDLSMGGVLSLAGCVAVLAGAVNPLLGVGLALAVGAASGLIQAGIMWRLGLGSISVTLGGLLVMSGLSFVEIGRAHV